MAKRSPHGREHHPYESEPELSWEELFPEEPAAPPEKPEPETPYKPALKVQDPLSFEEVRKSPRAPRKRQGGQQGRRSVYTPEPSLRLDMPERSPKVQKPQVQVPKRPEVKPERKFPERTLRLDMPERRPQPKEEKPEPELRIDMLEWKAEVPKAKPKVPKAKPKQKVFSRGFKRGFWISVILFAAILLAALAFLWNALKKYEAGLPDHVIAEVTEALSQADFSHLHPELEDGRALSDEGLFVDAASISAFLSGENSKQAFAPVKVSAETSETESVYLIRSGEETIARVSLQKNADGNGWTESKTTLLGDAFRVQTIRAQIPSSAKLKIGDSEIPRRFVTEEGAQIELLARLIEEGFLTAPPTLDTYTVEGIFPDAAPAMQKKDGTVVPLQLAEGVYLGGFEADEKFTEKQKKRVLSMFEPYARYFSGDEEAGVLSEIMLDNSPAYDSASSADVSWMQEHEDVTLSEERAENFQKYTDGCFSCDIHFVEDIYQDGEVVRSWDTNMTWVFLKDGEYYIADFMTKNQEN